MLEKLSSKNGLFHLSFLTYSPPSDFLVAWPPHCQCTFPPFLLSHLIYMVSGRPLSFPVVASSENCQLQALHSDHQLLFFSIVIGTAYIETNPFPWSIIPAVGYIFKIWLQNISHPIFSTVWPYHSIIKRWSLFLYHFLEKSVTALIGKSIVKVTLPIRNSACNGPDSFHFLFGAFASSWMPGAMYDVWLSWDHAGKTSHMEKLESEIPDMEWRSHLEIYSQARHSRLQMQ